MKALMRLQLALDGPLDASLELLQHVNAYVDVVEIGTPLVFREGMKAVYAIRQQFPHLELLADLKIMDAGREEALIAFESGCDWVSVLGVAPDHTVRGAVEAAQSFGKEVMVDLIQVPEIVERSQRLLDMGCHCLCVHTAYDLQQHGMTPFSDLERLRHALPTAPLAVAGGIGIDTIPVVLPFSPHIVIVGGALTRASNPVLTAQKLRQQMDG